MKFVASLMTAAVLFGSVSSAACRAASDELYSDIQSGSVFQGTNTARSSSGERMQTAEDLREVLKAAGFDARVAGTRQATARKKLDPWTFPLLLELSEDESTITVSLGLATISDSKTLTTDKLLQMMNLTRRHAPSMVLFNADRQRTEICRTMDNDGLSADQLRRTINRMAVLAKNSAALWASEEQSKQTQSPTQPGTPPSTQTPPPTQPAAPSAPVNSMASLSGKWAASRSATEAFGIEFRQDGTFNLVYVNNGQQSKSSGRFTLSGGNLQLNGNDGLKLSGRLTRKSAAEFLFEPAGSAAMTFRRAQQS